MIILNLTDREGRSVLIAAGGDSAIEITEAGQSQKWHGVMANVRAPGHEWREVRETVAEIAKQLMSQSGGDAQ